jgi:hypothetical protein
MPNPGRIRITKNSNLTTPLIDYRGALSNFIEWDGQFQITEFGNDDYIEYDFEENEWYFNLYANIPGSSLSNLSDVNLGTLVDLDVLVYDILTGKWINSDKLHTAIQNIAGIENEIATINQINIDQQTSIDTINTEISTINAEIGSTGEGRIPEGGIIMWSGDVVPNDWVLCDGNYSTPNLVDKFIIAGTPNNAGPQGIYWVSTQESSSFPSKEYYILAFIMRRYGFVSNPFDDEVNNVFDDGDPFTNDDAEQDEQVPIFNDIDFEFF